MKQKFTAGKPATYRGVAVVIGKDKEVDDYGHTYYYVRPIIAKKTGCFIRSDYLRTV